MKTNPSTTIAATLLIFCLSCKLISAQPSIDNLLDQVETHLKSNQFQEAFGSLEQAATNTTINDTKERQKVIDHYIQLSRETNYRSDGLTAYKICDSARNRFPKEPAILTQWGKAALAIGKEQKEVLGAVASSLSSTDNHSNDPETAALYQALMGINLTNLKDKDIVGNPTPQKTMVSEGITKLQEAVKSDPRWFLPHFFLGRVYTSQKDYQRSIQSYEEGRKKNPNFFSHVDYVLLASLYNDQKQFIKTRALLSEIPSRYPYLPGVHLMLGEAEFGLENSVEAFYQVSYELFIGGTESYFYNQTRDANVRLFQKYLT